MDQLWIARLGQVPYAEARDLQRSLEARRLEDEVPDTLLLLEHPPVYTKGRRTEPGELGMGEDWYRMQGIEVTEADRGGRVTYHGPGQLVGYPIVSLRELPSRGGSGGGLGVADYVRVLERLMIDALDSYGVHAGVIRGLTGVWAGSPKLLTEGVESGEVASEVAGGELRKIGSIGVHVNRGVTTHGFAVNVNNDLQPFEWIVPCGIEGCRMTSLCRELGAVQEMSRVIDVVATGFAALCGRSARELDGGGLRDLLAAAAGAAVSSG